MNEFNQEEIRPVEIEEEAEALEGADDATAEVETVKNEIPDTLAEALQLTDAEKTAYEKIGVTISADQTEGYIKGYKQGACHERLIPIES